MGTQTGLESLPWPVFSREQRLSPKTLEDRTWKKDPEIQKHAVRTNRYINKFTSLCKNLFTYLSF